jgi:DNA modification methylase
MQLEWAQHVAQHTGGKVLVLAPLAVAAQTVREGEKFGIKVLYVKEDTDIATNGDGYSIFITNYERLDKFDCEQFQGVVLDESSILKAFTSKTRNNLMVTFANTPYKLCCTATPSPNDTMELANHAQFLDVADRLLWLSSWFTHDSGNTSDWRLKKHAVKKFWKHVTDWAVCISEPKDLGEKYDMPEFILPELHIINHELPATDIAHQKAYEQGMLFPVEAVGLNATRQAKRDSMVARVKATKQMVLNADANTPILIWCELNDEAAALKEALPDAVEVNGSQKQEIKEEYLLGFAQGKYRILITKTKIAGFGLNYQHCHEMVFMSGTFSFEKTYQGLRRCWRFGQKHEVNAHNIYTVTEGNVQKALAEKRKLFQEMQKQMNEAMREHGLFRGEIQKGLVKVETNNETGKDWTMHLGDCVAVTKQLEDDSIDYSVFSPPFSDLFTYSNAEADMGNSAGDDEFFKHFSYLIKELYRVTAPGRIVSVHCSDLPTYKWRDGHIGIVDFPGKIIAEFQKHGWIYHNRITIWKNPVVEVTRTKANSLLHKTFVKDSCATRVGLPDYIVEFRKWPVDGQTEVKQKRIEGDYIGDNPPPPNDGTTEYSIDVWQRYASPVWFDINQTNVLKNYRKGRGDNDEKHICPLQLDVIARLIEWRSNKNDTVFSPFAGIGSEGFQAIKQGRKFVGIELKPEYHAIAVKNLKEAEMLAGQTDLFSFAGIEVETIDNAK